MAVENQVLTFALAVHAGLVLKAFFDALMRDIVLPLLSPLASVEGGVSKLVIQVGTIKINIGDAVVQTLNLFLAFAVVSLVMPYIREYVPVAGRR
jgi:large-conductance mechanosensitive channel